MEFETYADVIDSYNSGVGVEAGETLTDYIKRNNIKIKEIDMDPIGDFEKILKGDKPVEKEGIETIQLASGNKDMNIRIEKVVEEFIKGSNYGFTSIIKNKKICFDFVDNEYYFQNTFSVSGASCPSDVPIDAVKKIIKESEKIANLLNLKDGIFHVQFIMSDKGPVIIDITRRPPGDLYIKLVEHATGISYSDILLKNYTG